MKKQHIFIGGGIIVALIAIFAICLSIQTQAKNDQEDEKTEKKELAKEDYILEDTPESKIETSAKKIDTDSNSITVLVNKEYRLGEDYKPDDLEVPDIKFSFSYADEKRNMREEAARAIELLFAGASYEGYELAGVSGYRSFVRQTTLYNYNLRNKGYDYTSLYSARQGASEHQTGLAMDISSASVYYKLTEDFGKSKEGKWVQENGYKYGFIIRYPKNKTDITGYGYEPWHIRYVGYDLAKYLYDNKLTLEEYYGYTPNTEWIENEQRTYYNDLTNKQKRTTTTVSPDKKSVGNSVKDNMSKDKNSIDKSSTKQNTIDKSTDSNISSDTTSINSTNSTNSTVKTTASPIKSYSAAYNTDDASSNITDSGSSTEPLEQTVENTEAPVSESTVE